MVQSGRKARVKNGKGKCRRQWLDKSLFSKPRKVFDLLKISFSFVCFFLNVAFGEG